MVSTTIIRGFALSWTASCYCISTDVAFSKGIQATVVLKEVCKRADLELIRTARYQEENIL